MVLVRIQSSLGRQRVEVDAFKCTLRQFRELVSEKLGVVDADVGLSLDAMGRKPLMGDNAMLCELGVLEDGTEVFVFVDSKKMADHEKPAPTPPVTKSMHDVMKLTHHNKEAHKYKTFEDFLAEHDFNVTQLPLSCNFRAVTRNASGPTPLPPSISLKHQVYRHVDHVEVMNVDALNRFVVDWKQQDMAIQKVAYLIGYYTSDAHYGQYGTRAVAEAIYHPPQEGHFSCFELLPDPNWETVVTLVKALGLELVGWVFTHHGRDKLIVGPELVAMAKQQLRFLHHDVHYTGYPVSSFVTITVSPKEALQGEVGCDAFMLSDLGLALVRDGVLDECDFPEEGKYVQVRKPTTNELMPTVLETSKEVDRMDTDWLLVRLAESAPKESRCLLKRNTFPPPNACPTFQDVLTFLEGCPQMAAHERLADFNFLLFVAMTLGCESAAMIVEAILSKSDIPADFYTLLRSL